MEMDEYKDIVNIMTQTPPVRPPEDFTSKVMTRIPDFRPGICLSIREALFRPRTAHMLNGLGGAPTRSACSLYFVLAGFFYSIVGIVLVAGFEKIGGEIFLARWIKLQPQIAFVTAFVLILLGVFLLKRSTVVIKTAHLAILIYTGFVIINGIALQMALHIPAAMVVILWFMGGGVLMGVFLANVLQKYLKNLEAARA
jgi:hypothetical protein